MGLSLAVLSPLACGAAQRTAPPESVLAAATHEAGFDEPSIAPRPFRAARERPSTSPFA